MAPPRGIGIDTHRRDWRPQDLEGPESSSSTSGSAAATPPAPPRPNGHDTHVDRTPTDVPLATSDARPIDQAVDKFPYNGIGHDAAEQLDLTPDQARYREIFMTQQRTDASSVHANTLIAAFTDGQISGTTPQARLQAILGATANVSIGGPGPHFHPGTVSGLGTGGPLGVGDLGFRRELRDSIQFRPAPDGSDVPMHLASSNQTGHFLTAVDIGFEVTRRDNYIAAQNAADAEFRAEHPVQGFVRDMITDRSSLQLQFAFERQQYMTAMVGHEMVGDGESKLGDGLGALANGTPAAVAAFEAGQLDRIPIDDSRPGNSYQDLLLTKVGFEFGKKVANGELPTNAEAARWLEMMLTDTDLSAVPRSDPFYADAQRMQGWLSQFSANQERIHPL